MSADIRMLGDEAGQLPMENKWLVGCDPFKKIKWYHRVKKLFGGKVKTGSIVIFKWKDKSKTTIEVIKQSDTYL